MKHYTIYLLLAFLLFKTLAVKAQQTITNIPKEPTTWQQYDSLGDAAMFNGDTSTAIGYYEKAVELNTEDREYIAAREKLKRHYRHAASSFYLKEY